MPTSLKPRVPNHRTTRRDEILLIMKCGDTVGMTAEEIAATLFADGRTPSPSCRYVRPRLTELRNDGLIAASDRKKSHTSGMPATVWKLTKRGWSA